MATDLGKVGMRMRGTWDSSTAYEVLDAVSYTTGLYIAKQAVPAGTLPTNTTYWQLATDVSQLTDGIGFSMNSNNASNILIKYMGNNTTFKLSGSFSNTGAILLYAGYPNVTGGGLNLRGLWIIDSAGNVKELTTIGATLPVITVNTEKTEMTITLPFSYAYIFMASFRQYAFSM